MIGYGNTLRSDDGAGAVIAQEIERERFVGVEVRTCQQLHMELVSEFADYDRVILADACIDGEEVTLSRISSSSQSNLTSSHHLGPEFLLRLSEITNSRSPELYICMVRGESFGFGERLSEKMVRRTREAANRIKNLISGAKVLGA